jgi:hypothetical protein
MADYFLNKLGTKLPSVQGRQVMRLLEKKRQLGELRTLDDLRDKLKELTDDLLQKRIKPTFRLWPAVGKEDISSEKYNDMMERTEQDLEAIFEEANNLYDILDVHNFLIKEVALRDIESGLNNLEGQVALYEFLIDAEDSYSDGIFNTFKDTTGSFIDASAQVAKFLFADHRATKSISPTKRAIIDLVGEQIIMAPEEETYISPKGAEHLAGSFSTRSELDAYFPDIKVSNLIDNTTGTYWAVPILVLSQANNGVYAEIAIDLPSAQDITFLEIEPATTKPMILQSVAYLDSAKQTRYISTTEITLNHEKTTLFFNTANTVRVFLRFQQKNFTELQFKQNLVSNTSRVIGQGTQYTRLESIDLDEDVVNSISSPFISEDILGLDNTDFGTSRRYYEYIVALDNIKVGRHKYQDLSFFASNKKHTKDLRQIALRVDEVRPMENFIESSAGISLASQHTYPARTTDEDQKFYHGSVEYLAIIELLNQAGEVEMTGIVPVLPLQAERVYHERLIFTNKIRSLSLLKDAGALRFYCEESNTDIVVYRNGLPLVYATDWEFVATGHATGLTVETPGTGTRMKRGIQILSRERQSDFYTISYTPKKGSSYLSPSGASLLTVVDLIGDLSMRLTPNGTIIVEAERVSSSIVSANVYLQIIMRRNSQNNRVSPSVQEFLLAIGSKDENRYVKETF